MCSLKQSPCDHYFTFTLFLLLYLLRASFYIVCYSLYYLPLMFPNAVKNSVTFYKSSKLLFFEKIVKISRSKPYFPKYWNVSQYVT